MCSWKFRKIHRKTPFVLRNFQKTFFTEQTVRLLLLLAFQKQPPERFYEKMFLKISQNSKENTFALQIFKTPFLQNTSGRLFLFWLFCATLLKWDTANSVWKTSDEYLLSRNTNLRSTVQVYHFFFQQDKLSVYVFIGLHCLLPEAAIRVEVFCKKRCS